MQIQIKNTIDNVIRKFLTWSFFWEGTWIFSQAGKQVELAIQNRVLNFFTIVLAVVFVVFSMKTCDGQKVGAVCFLYQLQKRCLWKSIMPLVFRIKIYKKLLLFLLRFLTSRNQTVYAKICQSENTKSLLKTKQMKRILIDWWTNLIWEQ